MSWVVIKYEKMRFLATLRRATFYILLSRGSAIGTLLDVTLLAYASDEKLYSAHANFLNQANRSSQTKIELATENSRVCNKAPAGEKGSTRSTLSIRCTVKQT